MPPTAAPKAWAAMSGDSGGAAGLPAGLLAQQAGDDLGRLGSSKQEALPTVAAQRPQLGSLCLAFDTLAHHAQLKRPGQRDHTLHDRGVEQVMAETLDERVF